MTSTTHDLTTVPTEILKTDCKGRIRFPAAIREELLDRFEHSSMSGAEFAEFYNIKYSTFASWRQKRDRERRKAARQPEADGFVELAMPAEEVGCGSGLRVNLPGGASVRVADREAARLAAELIRALGNRPC